MDFLHDDFQHRLHRLNQRQSVAFMAALCERLLPNYALYADTTENGDVAALHNILDLVWETLLVPGAHIDFDRQADKLGALQPPSNDDSFGARRALDAVVALSATLDTLRGEAVDSVVEVSRVSQAGVIAFIEMTVHLEEDATLQRTVRDHPLMDDERHFQQAVLEHTEQMSSRDSVKALRRLGRNNGVSNLGLTLD
ncbi:YjaG family protein [Aidingimonas halophila]|uniref:DUF416 domain-containing protein n=1 Tax=Aidingimonas halophila TaxID=574349 RepID=A0A1H2Z277_9GAMM|nr:YjaG family protein [Aidingimonas halophila]GHC15191.1 hypothetical protein GCM10008094_00090 [Aidingimonas halophila]SDX11108.1 hypothetical protein SAMN05443545_1049 [Aidingimonas halophila]